MIFTHPKARGLVLRYSPKMIEIDRSPLERRLEPSKPTRIVLVWDYLGTDLPCRLTRIEV